MFITVPTATGTYEAYDDSPFLDSGLFEHAWELWTLRMDLVFMHWGLHAKAANNVRRTLFPSQRIGSVSLD